MLDYGCGVADPSLFLALNGADITIVDLDTKKFNFTKFRFKKRNIDINSISANQTETPIQLPKNIKFDLIILSEFLEHVRSPKKFLDFALSHLKTNGIIYDSLGAVHNHGTVGDHLVEAKLEMEKTGYENYFEKKLEPLESKYNNIDYKHFYIKK